MADITLELYGIARKRAGAESVVVRAKSLPEALLALESAFPALSGEVVKSGRLAPHWRASLDGTRFLAADEAIPPGSRVVILSGLAGG